MHSTFPEGTSYPHSPSAQGTQTKPAASHHAPPDGNRQCTAVSQIKIIVWLDPVLLRPVCLQRFSMAPVNSRTRRVWSAIFIGDNAVRSLCGPDAPFFSPSYGSNKVCLIMSSTVKTEGSEHRSEHKQDANTVTAGSLISLSSNAKIKVKIKDDILLSVLSPHHFFKASTV